MINEKYYNGFEGEVEVLLYCRDNRENKNGWRIWDGYFQTLLSGCFIGEPLDTGLLKSYMTQEGFYDESPWKVIDNLTVITELNQFNKSNLETDSTDMIMAVVELRSDLLNFMKEALNNHSQVYVEYN